MCVGLCVYECARLLVCAFCLLACLCVFVLFVGLYECVEGRVCLCLHIG